VRRLGLIVGGAFTTVMFLAGSAFAASGSYPPPVTTPPPAPTDPGTGVAFTGANISLGLIILITLLVTGLVLLLAGRRRQPRAAR
jgi:hypothetical protein